MAGRSTPASDHSYARGSTTTLGPAHVFGLEARGRVGHRRARRRCDRHSARRRAPPARRAGASPSRPPAWRALARRARARPGARVGAQSANLTPPRVDLGAEGHGMDDAASGLGSRRRVLEEHERTGFRSGRFRPISAWRGCRARGRRPGACRRPGPSVVRAASRSWKSTGSGAALIRIRKRWPSEASLPSCMPSVRRRPSPQSAGGHLAAFRREPVDVLQPVLRHRRAGQEVAAAERIVALAQPDQRLHEGEELRIALVRRPSRAS